MLLATGTPANQRVNSLRTIAIPTAARMLAAACEKLQLAALNKYKWLIWVGFKGELQIEIFAFHVRLH